MAPSQEPSVTPAKPRRSGPLDKFPAEIRAAHARFLANGDVDALDTVVLAIVRDHQPSHTRSGDVTAPLADSASLVGDLGFDSLAFAEIVFFIEELYSVSIGNDELLKITTVGELRAFVRAKVSTFNAPRPAAS